MRRKMRRSLALLLTTVLILTSSVSLFTVEVFAKDNCYLWQKVAFYNFENATSAGSVSDTVNTSNDITVEELTEPVEKVNTVEEWQSVAEVDFENAATDAVTTITSGVATISNSTYSASANNAMQDGATASAALVSVADFSSYSNLNNNNMGSKTLKFDRTGSPLAMTRINNLFDMSAANINDKYRFTAWVYTNDVENPEGTTSPENTSVLNMYLSKSGVYNSGSYANINEGTSISIPSNQWIQVGFTFNVTQDMITNKVAGVRFDAFTKGVINSFAKETFIDNIKVEKYTKREGTIKEGIDTTENMEFYPTQFFDSSTHLKDIMAFFGGNSDKPTITSEKAYSNVQSVKLANRRYSSSAIKMLNIFGGEPTEEDIGRTFRISVKIYADKNSGVYTNTGTIAAGYTDAVEFTPEQYAQSKGTNFYLGIGGPNGNNYLHRQAQTIFSNFFVPWNTWTELHIYHTVTRDTISNGSLEALSDPLINSAKVAQQAVNGSLNNSLVNTFYLDDFRVEEIDDQTSILQVPSIFYDNMVIQRNKPIPVWGTGTVDGANVEVTLGGVTKNAVVENGEWSVEFDALPAQTGLTLEVKGGREEIFFENVAIGEVWICSGQSNMQWPLKSSLNTEDIIANAANYDVRLFTQDGVGAYEEQNNVLNGKWSVADSDNAGNFSALGYIMGYQLQDYLDVPIGLVRLYLGGARAEAFLDLETLKARPEYASMVSSYEAAKITGDTAWKSIPTSLYNRMFKPIISMNAAGVLWYQGESNSGSGSYQLYDSVMTDLIAFYRQKFNDKNLPFVIFQLAPYYNVNYPIIRQIQLDLTKKIPNTYLITTAWEGTNQNDVDTDQKIHPSLKLPVGNRCAHTVLYNVYGATHLGEYSGPEYESMTINGNKAILTFTHLGNGVTTEIADKPLTGFKISSDGINFVDATAQIVGDTIEVYADGITSPVEVRYGYTDIVEEYDNDGILLRSTLGGNLTNVATHYPASPFIASVIKPSFASFKVYDSQDKEIQTLTDQHLSEGINVHADILNSGYSAGNQKLLIGLYDGNKLVSIQAINTNFKTASQKTFIEYFENSNPSTTGYKIKVFLWNENMKPFDMLVK